MKEQNELRNQLGCHRCGGLSNAQKMLSQPLLYQWCHKARVCQVLSSAVMAKVEEDFTYFHVCFPMLIASSGARFESRGGHFYLLA